MPKEILIVGAGLSGLVAGINLSREGFDVRILEAKQKIGGNAAYIDSTYISPQDIKDFAGVDISGALDPWERSTIYAFYAMYFIYLSSPIFLSSLPARYLPAGNEPYQEEAS